MKPVFSVTTPNGAQYNIERASATAQKSLMMLIGSRLTIINANPMSPAEAVTSNEMLVGALLAMSEADFDRVAAIVLPKIVKGGTTEIVTIESFQGDMMSYLYMVAGAVRENLDDFFIWLLHQQGNGKTQSATPAAVNPNLTQ